MGAQFSQQTAIEIGGEKFIPIDLNKFKLEGVHHIVKDKQEKCPVDHAKRSTKGQIMICRILSNSIFLFSICKRFSRY